MERGTCVVSRFPLSSLWVLGASASVFLGRDARAVGPVDVEVAGELGFGTNPLSRGGDEGGTFAYPSSLITFAHPPASASTRTYGFEAGYDFRFLGLLTVRPQLGAGELSLSYTQPYGSGVCGFPCSGVDSGRVDNLYLQPGVTLLESVGVFVVGIDASLLVLPNMKEPFVTSSSTDLAFTTHLQAGLRF